jgi:hypothetical protein
MKVKEKVKVKKVKVKKKPMVRDKEKEREKARVKAKNSLSLKQGKSKVNRVPIFQKEKVKGKEEKDRVWVPIPLFRFHHPVNRGCWRSIFPPSIVPSLPTVPVQKKPMKKKMWAKHLFRPTFPARRNAAKPVQAVKRINRSNIYPIGY